MKEDAQEDLPESEDEILGLSIPKYPEMLKRVPEAEDRKHPPKNL